MFEMIHRPDYFVIQCFFFAIGSAKEKAPCVIFIDEIDSVGSKRSDSVFHPYANQTINQLLTEMDGFNKNEGVIVLGATNRKQVLDKALLRPGRFDMEVKASILKFGKNVHLFRQIFVTCFHQKINHIV